MSRDENQAQALMEMPPFPGAMGSIQQPDPIVEKLGAGDSIHLFRALITIDRVRLRCGCRDVNLDDFVLLAG